MQLVVAAAGAAVGGAIYPGVIGLGITGASLGWMVGSALGASLVKPKTQYNIQSPATDLRVTGTEYGQMIPVIIGHDRVAGQIWWASDFRPIPNTTVSGGGGKGGGGAPTVVTTTYTYECDFVLGLTDHEIAGVSRLWIDGGLVYNVLNSASEASINASINSERWTRMTVYFGTATQLPDPVYEDAVGSDMADGIRHRAYIFFEGFKCGDAPRLPNITAEVYQSGTGGDPGAFSEDFSAGLVPYSLVTGSLSYFDIVATDLGAALRLIGRANLGVDDQISRSFTEVDVKTMRFKFRVNESETDDAGLLQFYNDNDLRFEFNPRRETGSDPDRRCEVYLASNNSYLGVAALDLDEWHEFVLTVAQGPGNSVMTITRLSDSAEVINHVYALDVDDLQVNRLRFNNVDTFSSFSSAETDYTDIELFGTGATIDEITLREAVEQLCERAGLESTDYDASALDAITKPVHALPIYRVGPTRPLLEQLMAFYFFDVRVRDKLYFVPRAGAVVATLAYNDLGAHMAGEDPPEPFALEMASGIEQPSKLVLTYRSVDADYTTASVESDPLVTVLNDSVGEISTDLAMTDSEAKAAINVMARDQYIAQTGAQIAVTGKWDKLEAADRVGVTDADGNVFYMRSVEVADAFPLIQLKLTREDPAIYESQGITGAVSGGSSVVNPPADTVLQALDIPLLRDVDDTPGYYVAAKGSSTPWPSAGAYTSPDDVAYVQRALFGSSSVIGTCTTVLADWTGGDVFDEAGRVTVNVGSGELSSSTRAALIASKAVNLCAIGEHGRWELLQFRTATLVSAGVYTLSGLLRGVQGTEWAMVDHEASETFVLLTLDGLRRIELENAGLGVAHYVKGVTLGRLLSTADGEAFTCNGVSLTPRSPVDFRVSRDGSDNCTLTWRRRTRRSCRLFGSLGISVPLGEASEAYEVDIYDDNTYTTVVRTISAASETASYTAAEQTADGLTPGDPIYAKVYQLSEIVGRGYELEGTA